MAIIHQKDKRTVITYAYSLFQPGTRLKSNRAVNAD